MKLKLWYSPLIILILVTGVLFPAFVSGQTAILSGKITDEKNKPVELANVAILGEKGGTTTNSKGEYELRVPANKDLIIAITYVGFAEKKIPMNLIDGEIKSLDIQLESAATVLPSFEVKDENLRTESMVRLNPKDAQVAPSLTEGVSDIIKTLPGV